MFKTIKERRDWKCC